MVLLLYIIKPKVDMKIGIIIASALATMASATTSWGRCEDLRLADHFKLEDYTGLWYEQMRDNKIMFEKGDCLESRYSLVDGRKNSMYVLFSQF